MPERTIPNLQRAVERHRRAGTLHHAPTHIVQNLYRTHRQLAIACDQAPIDPEDVARLAADLLVQSTLLARHYHVVFGVAYRECGVGTTIDRAPSSPDADPDACELAASLLRRIDDVAAVVAYYEHVRPRPPSTTLSTNLPRLQATLLQPANSYGLPLAPRLPHLLSQPVGGAAVFDPWDAPDLQVCSDPCRNRQPARSPGAPSCGVRRPTATTRRSPVTSRTRYPTCTRSPKLPMRRCSTASSSASPPNATDEVLTPWPVPSPSC